MKLTFLVLLIFFPFIVSAQNLEDVLYHSNGSVIRGKLLSQGPGGSIRILNHSGDIWSFSPEEVDSVKSEKVFNYEAFIFNQDGMEFSLSADLFMRSQGSTIGKPIVPGINLGTYYRKNSFFSGGIEAGINIYEWMVLPVTASLRIRTSERTASPFLRANVGYSFPLEERSDDADYSFDSKGGLNASAGMGFEKIINKDIAFIISIAYHYQALNYHLEPVNPIWVIERDRKESYSRLRVSVMYVIK